MRRRDFVGLIAGIASWPALLRAQQAKPIVGYLSSRSLGDSTHILAAFRKGLAEAGYIEGQDVTVEYRWAEGSYGRLPGLADELVRFKPSVLVAAGGEPSALAAKAATSSIPIVFSIGGDPVKIGLAQSLNRPGGNATGISLLTTAPEAKRLGLLHELVPQAKMVGVLVDRRFQESDLQIQEVDAAAHKIGQAIEVVYATDDPELDTAFDKLRAMRVDALLVCAAPFFDTRRERIVEFETQQRIPAIYQFREYTVQGGLMSYGISLPEGYRQVGVYVGQILKGAAPAELPVVQSIKFEFVINLKSARAMGIEIPANLLARADDVIE